MKSKEKKQLIGKTVAELAQDVVKAQNEIQSMLLDRVQGKLKNTSSFTNKRKDIAILKTIIREKEMNHENI